MIYRKNFFVNFIINLKKNKILTKFGNSGIVNIQMFSNNIYLSPTCYNKHIT